MFVSKMCQCTSTFPDEIIGPENYWPNSWLISWSDFRFWFWSLFWFIFVSFVWFWSFLWFLFIPAFRVLFFVTKSSPFSRLKSFGYPLWERSGFRFSRKDMIFIEVFEKIS